MADRTILHRTDLPPEGDGGRLIVPIDVVDITGAAMREDHQAVALKLQAASGDRVLLGMAAPMVDALIETLTKIRAEMDAHDVEQTIPFSPVHSCQVGIHEVEGVQFVSMILDRSLQSARAYLMPPKPATILAQQIEKAARKAERARSSQIIRPPKLDG